MKRRRGVRTSNRSAKRRGREAVVIGGTVDEAAVAIQLLGKQLDPDRVTRLLGVVPTFSRHRGELTRPPCPARSIGGNWLLKVRRIQGKDVESKLWTLLKKIGRRRKAWSTVLTTSGAKATCRLGLFLRAWNRGLVLSPELLVELGRRRIGLSLDIYGDDGRLESAPKTRRRRPRSAQ